jgi:hypothetical protein
MPPTASFEEIARVEPLFAGPKRVFLIEYPYIDRSIFSFTPLREA